MTKRAGCYQLSRALSLAALFPRSPLPPCPPTPFPFVYAASNHAMINVVFIEQHMLRTDSKSVLLQVATALCLKSKPLFPPSLVFPTVLSRLVTVMLPTL